MPVDLGAGTKLWLRPEELLNPNLARYTENIDEANAGWADTLADITATTGHTDPNGENTAWLLAGAAGGSRYKQVVLPSLAEGKSFIGSVWWKRGPGHNGISTGSIKIYSANENTSHAAVPPVEWAQIDSGQLDITGGGLYCRLELSPSTQSVYFWHPQVESGSAVSPYRPNAATSGGLLASWPDQSGNGNDFTQGTQAAMPIVETNALDGFPGARMDGVDDKLILASYTAAQPLHVFTVHLLDTGDNGPHHLFHSGTPNLYTTDYFYGPRMYAGILIGSISEYSAGTPVLFHTIFEGNDSEMYINNVKLLDSPAGTNAPSSSYCRIGGDAGGGNCLKGLLIEQFHYSGALSGDDDADILAYFGNKYPSLGL
jgi:hypothetical protein